MAKYLIFIVCIVCSIPGCAASEVEGNETTVSGPVQRVLNALTPFASEVGAAYKEGASAVLDAVVGPFLPFKIACGGVVTYDHPLLTLILLDPLLRVLGEEYKQTTRPFREILKNPSNSLIFGEIVTVGLLFLLPDFSFHGERLWSVIGALILDHILANYRFYSTGAWGSASDFMQTQYMKYPGEMFCLMIALTVLDRLLVS
jgi:hypothetical protein